MTTRIHTENTYADPCIHNWILLFGVIIAARIANNTPEFKDYT